MKIIQFSSDHLDEMADFGNQEGIARPMLGQIREARYEDLGPASSFCVDGRVIGCVGLFEVTQYRATVWALIAKQDFAQRFISIHRATKRLLDAQTYKRIDVQVVFDDRAGHRWMRLLGFKREVFCRPWFMPDGSAVSEYVRLK